MGGTVDGRDHSLDRFIFCGNTGGAGGRLGAAACWVRHLKTTREGGAECSSDGAGGDRAGFVILHRRAQAAGGGHRRRGRRSKPWRCRELGVRNDTSPGRCRSQQRMAEPSAPRARAESRNTGRVGPRTGSCRAEELISVTSRAWFRSVRRGRFMPDSVPGGTNVRFGSRTTPGRCDDSQWRIPSIP